MDDVRWGLGWRSLLALTVGCVCLLAGCDDADREPEPERVTISWVEHPLPTPAGAAGRSVVRDAVQCGDGWWVVGAVLLDRPTEPRDTRPAAWFSPDRRTWTSLPVATSTYWGRRAIINSIACSRDRIAAVGARSGGAHGNPRVTTFRMDGETLVDVPAPFVQYGGVTASNVGPIAGGPTGWLISGNRVSGPAVWFTDDPREFTRVEAEPGLTDDGGDWRLVDVPLAPQTAGDHSLMAVAGEDLLLVADAGDGGHVWVGEPVSP